MNENNIIDTDSFKDNEKLIHRLNELSLEGWITICSFGKHGRYFLLKREIKKPIVTQPLPQQPTIQQLPTY